MAINLVCAHRTSPLPPKASTLLTFLLFGVWTPCPVRIDHNRPSYEVPLQHRLRYPSYKWVRDYRVLRTRLAEHAGNVTTSTKRWSPRTPYAVRSSVPRMYGLATEYSRVYRHTAISSYRAAALRERQRRQSHAAQPGQSHDPAPTSAFAEPRRYTQCKQT